MKDPNWFYSLNIDKLFAKHLNQFVDKPVTFLQIGVFTGNASKWLAENILTHPESKLIDVDSWSFLPNIAGLDSKEVEETYNVQLQEYIKTGKVVKVQAYSSNFFKNNTEVFDFIYIDGNHSEEAVVKDGTNALKILSSRGIISFDDYNMLDIDASFREKKRVSYVKNGVNRLDFTDFSILEDEECYQFWVQKNDHTSRSHNDL